MGKSGLENYPLASFRPWTKLGCCLRENYLYFLCSFLGGRYPNDFFPRLNLILLDNVLDVLRAKAPEHK
jgi:hypothetical protein